MPPAFLQLSAVLVLATVLGILAKILKQPLIVAYIASGIIVSYLGAFRGGDREIFDLFSNLGIAFLLFLVGVDLKFEDLKYLGKASFITGIGQIVFTTLVGFILIGALGFDFWPSLYMAFAITFSSTVIIIKLLSEKGHLQSLYGKISVGFLLVQDFVAILFLMVVSGLGSEALSFGHVFSVLARGLILVVGAYLASRYLLKSIFKLVSTSIELLFVSAIAWAFAFSAIAVLLGFSTAIGAFLAGLVIASSPYSLQISARVRPIRDFFIIIFFILLGASSAVGAANVNVWHVVVLSVFTLIGNPLIVLAIMMTLGFRNRTSFLSSVTVAQVSEFSLILMTVGVTIGVVNSDMVSLISAVAIVTIALSSYLILYGENIYRFFEKPFSAIFPEKLRDPYVSNRDKLKDHIILIGAEQMGWDILKFLKTKEKDLEQILVIDFNPTIIKTLKASGFNTVFGDITDPELLEELELSRAKLIVITDVDINDCANFIKFAKSKDYKGPVVASTYWLHDAIKLYEIGADYVVVPETVGGKHVSKLLSEYWENLGEFKRSKSKHFEDLMAHKVF